ncbi:MAG: hypothetical protein ABJC13_15030 [Acidobacteriota bacterium]
MRKKGDLKKLTLSRDTLLQLTTKQARVVEGAVLEGTSYCTGNSVYVCCAE